MDEATAAIDSGTDAFIQHTVRAAFADRTVLTIAHRLHTIRGADRVLVMRDGRLVEFDTPDALLANARGVFRSMVDEAEAAHKSAA